MSPCTRCFSQRILRLVKNQKRTGSRETEIHFIGVAIIILAIIIINMLKTGNDATNQIKIEQLPLTVVL